MATQGLHVEVEGAGPGLVLAHGFGGSARNFRPQVRALREGFRVATYDARGHARSSAPPDPAAYTEEALVADLASVASGLGPGPVVAGGLSMGAAVALAFARRHPARVRGLVLASYPAGPGADGGVSRHALAFAEALEREGLEAAGERFVWGPGSGLDPKDAALVRQGFLEHDARGLALTLRGFLARLPEVEALAPELARLEVPALIVAGERDTAALPACRAVAEVLPRGRLEVIPGAGHVVNLMAPRAFNALLRTFLEGLHAAAGESFRAPGGDGGR